MAHWNAQHHGFAWGMAIGVALGGAVVLIFTPRTGEEVREGIGEAAHLLTERLRGALAGESSAIAPPPADMLTPRE